MAQLLVRNLEDWVVKRLKEQAESRGVSLEQYLREILRVASKPSMAEIREDLRQIQESYVGKTLSDSTEAIHEDRYG